MPKMSQMSRGTMKTVPESSNIVKFDVKREHKRNKVREVGFVNDGCFVYSNG